MKITVFGGAGFLGSHVSDKLSDAGHEVTIFDIHHSPWLRADQKMVIGDILDQEKVDASIADADVVYNFAGIADIGEANMDLVRTTRLNVLGNSFVLDACVRHKIKRFVYASTLYVYSKDGGFYRCSKQACELFIEHCQATYGLDYTILRYGSLYGPRSDNRNAIYRFVREALETKKINYYGHPTALREYVHVEDAALTSVEILGPEFANQNIIITGNQPMRVNDVLKMISEMLGGDIEFKYLREGQTGHYEVTPYSFSPKIGKKIIPRLNTDLGQGILKVIEDVHQELNPNLSTVQDILLKKD